MIRKAWTGYALLLSAVVIVGEVANLSGGGAVDLRTVANWVVTALLLTATWGYALQRRIGSLRYWRPASWILLGASLATVVPAALAGPTARLMVAVLLPLVAPAFYATFRYAYRSPQLWQSRPGEPPSVVTG